MASIGLKILPSDNAGTGLASVLSKALFGDPEATAKATLMGTEAASHEAYARKLAADQAAVEQKTAVEAAAEAERQRAGPLEGETLAGAVPMPVPVTTLNPPVAGPEGWGSIGATTTRAPSQAEIDQYNRLTASQRALGPILVRGNPEQVAQGTGKAYGASILEGAANNPAIVSGDALRIAGGLYTGTAPSTTTVWSGGDTSGVDAAAREKIAEDAAKGPEIKEIGGVGYRVNPDGTLTAVTPAKPFGTDTVANDQQIVASLTAKQASGQTLSPDEQAQLDVAKTRLTKENAITQGKDQQIITPNPQGGATVISPKPDQQQGPITTFSGDAEGLQAMQVFHNLMIKAQNPATPLTDAEQLDLQQAAIKLGYGVPRTTYEKQPDGSLLPVTTIAPTPSIKPASAGPAPPVVPPVVQTPIPPTAPPPPNESQARARLFANSAGFANTSLDKIRTPDQLPGVISAMLATPSISGTGLIASLARANLPEDVKDWMRNALEFTAAINYEQSGAAVNPDEWENAKQIYIPMPNDSPSRLAAKAAARRNWIQSMASNGWSNDPGGLAKFTQTYLGPTQDGGPRVDGGGPPPKSGSSPPAGVGMTQDEWDHLDPAMQQRLLQKYGGGPK